MSRRPLKTTRLAVTSQAASLQAVAGGIFAILISDVTRHRTDAAIANASPPQPQLLALPH